MAEELNKNNIESSVDNVDKLYSTQEKPGDYYPIAPTAYDASALSIKDNIVGDPSSPNPYPSQIPPPNAKDVDWLTQTDILRSYVEGSTIAAQNPNQYARLYEFNSGPNNPNTFFQRYSTRGTSAFKEIDFHPIHNNEEALNSATNFLGDLKHTIGNSFFPIFIKGIQASYQSLPRMFITGDFFGEDKQFSRDYAYYNNLSYSSKDNLGSFVNNLTMNFAYTAGLLATAVFENWAGSAFSLGSAYRGLGSFTPYGQAIKNVRIGENIAGAAVDGGKVTNESMRHLNNLGNARKFWNWITGERTFAQFVTENPLTQAINPFSNLTRNYYARIGAIDDIAGMARTSSNFAKTAGAFWRDVRNVNLAVAEGRLESGMLYNTIVDKLYKEHYERTGAPPSVDLMKEFVNEAAKKAQYETAVMNVGLIYFTNKLAFDNLLNPRKNIFKENVKTVGKIGEAGKGEFKITLEQGQFKLNKPGFRTWLRGWKKDPISKSLKNTASYFKVNLLEGVQETSQEIISEATKNYYLDAYNDKTVRKSLFSKAAFGQGSTPLSYYGKAFEKFNPTTKEGFPIFASGFFMGFLSGGLANSVTTLQRQSYKIYDRSGYDAYIAKKEELGNELVDRLNSFGVDEFLNNRYFNAGVQARTATIQNEEDDKHIQDSETEALVSHMTYLMEQGVFEQYINSFEEFSEMTAKEFEEAFPKVPQGEGAEYQAKIPSVIEKAKRIQKEYEKVTKEYPNPINLDDYPTWREDHTEAVILHRAWNQALKQKIFYNESWVSVSKRLNSIKDTLLKEAPSQSLSKRDLDLILDIETKTGLKFEIATLKTEIESLTKNATPESKQLAKEKKKQLDTYQNYLDAYGEFRKQFKRDEYVDAARQVILNARSEEDKDAPITDEEIEKVITKEFGKVTEKTQEKSIENLKKAYAKLVKSAAEKNEAIFDNDIDESFSLVLDYYKLSDEKLGLANIINLLNDPNSFTELVGRNQDWMTDMWLNRQGYFNDIVKKEFQEIEDNGLLNALANEGVFISQADFIAWRDHDIMPEEFYDEKNEMVIPQESITYNKYMSLLETHKMLSNIQATISTAGLEQRIRNLNARRNEHLDKIENRLKEEIKIETGKTLEEVRQESEESSLSALNAELESVEKMKKDLKGLTTPEDVAENIKTVREQAEYFDDTVQENLNDPKNEEKIIKLGEDATEDATMPENKDERDLIIKNTGALLFTANQILDVAIKTLQEQIASAPETTLLEETKAYKFYTKSKDEVNKRYDNLIEQVKSKIESYEADKVETVTGEKVDIDYVEWAQLPEDLKPILFEAYDKYLESQDFDVAALKKDDRSKYLTLSNKWLKSDEAVAIIEKYNADIEAAKPKSVEELETPDLKTLQGKLEGKTIKQVKGLIQNREKALSESKDAKEREDLESDIATLNKYLDDLRALKKPQSPAERSYKLFEAMVLGKQNQVNRVKDENGQTIGYEFTSPATTQQQDALEEAATTTQVSNPIRVTQYAEQLKNQKYKLDPFEYNPVKEENIDRKGKKYRGGLLVEFDAINDMNLSTKQKIDNIITAIKVDKKYGPLQSDAKLESIRAALTNDFSLDNFKRIVNEVAFRQSRIAGNTVDELARIALTIDESGDFMKSSKPANMSEKAFEKLTGRNGIITRLQDWARDGDFFFYTGDALLFNKDLFDGRGIVGATDIIAFNKKTGELIIIDLKTSNKDIQSWDESKMYQYRAQQSIYRNLIYNMTGIMPSEISLLPMQVDVDIQNEGYINDIILEELDGTKPVKNSSAVGIEYLSDVEAGVPLIAPTDIPVELQGEVEDTGESFDPFTVPEELKEQFVKEGNIKSVEEIANKIRNAKTLDEANTAMQEAFILQVTEPAVAEAISKMLTEEFEAKKEALKENVDLENLGKGMILVSENPIFTNASNYVVVDKVYEKNGEPYVTVKSIGLKKAKQKSMSISEANSMFKKSTAEEAKAATTASQEAKDASAQSKQNQKEFNKNNEVPKSSEKTGMSPLDKIKNFTKNNKKDC